MPRRERNTERRGARQIQRPMILVVCGAERTEIAYLKGLRGHVERAKKIDPSGVEHGINPSTGMWRLVERIME